MNRASRIGSIVQRIGSSGDGKGSYLKGRILDISIVGEYITRNSRSRVLIDRDGIITRDGGIIDGCDGDVKLNGHGHIHAVGTNDRDLIEGTIPVGDGRKGVRTIDVDRQAALPCDVRHLTCGERLERATVTRVINTCDREGIDGDTIPFRVGGIMQNITVDSEVLDTRIGASSEHRRIVNRGDGEVDDITDRVDAIGDGILN